MWQKYAGSDYVMNVRFVPDVHIKISWLERQPFTLHEIETNEKKVCGAHEILFNDVLCEERAW